MVRSDAFEAVAEELESRFSAGVLDPWGETAFTSLALRVFRHQFDHNAIYRGFCERRGATPTDVDRWQDVPTVPATAFKHLDLVSCEDTQAEVVFRTSGTTGGGASRGRHLVPRASLYRAALMPTFRAHLLPDRESITFVSLIPSPEELPDSSLSYMVGVAAEALADEVRWVVDGVGELDRDGFLDVAHETAAAGRPVLLLGTALAFVHVLDDLGHVPLGPLADGSRIMETGGFKGRTREVPRAELHGRISDATGVPVDHIVNEYGMTEMLSQLYEPVLSEGPDAAGTHVPPPWLRVRALDPSTLDPVAEGEEGLLAFFDLANAGSVCHILTEDVGSVRDGRVRLSGRVSGSEPRGCSRAMDELMAGSATGSGR